MNDPTERLIAAWLAWEAAPTNRKVCLDRLAAVRAAGLPSNATHDLMGAARRAGMSIPDAAQTVIHHLGRSTEVCRVHRRSLFRRPHRMRLGPGTRRHAKDPSKGTAPTPSRSEPHHTHHEG